MYLANFNLLGTISLNNLSEIALFHALHFHGCFILITRNPLKRSFGSTASQAKENTKPHRLENLQFPPRREPRQERPCLPPS